MPHERGQTMLTVRLKDIRNTPAVNITSLTDGKLKELQQKENGLETIAMSYGVYGMNGGLYRGKATGELYKVTSRATALWALY